MTEYKVKDLKTGFFFFTDDMFLSQNRNFILQMPDVYYSENMKLYLKKWHVHAVYSDGIISQKSKHMDAFATSAGEHGIETIKILDDITTITENYQKYFKIIFDMYKNNDFLLGKLSEIITNLVSELRRNPLMGSIFFRVKTDEYSYFVQHVLHTCCLCLQLGILQKFSQPRLIEIGTVSLFHTIGLLMINKNILHNNISLSLDTVKMHPVYAKKLAVACKVSPTLAGFIYECFEQGDGTGYPNGKTLEQISTMPQLVRLASDFVVSYVSQDFGQMLGVQYDTQSILSNSTKLYNPLLLKVLTIQVNVYIDGTFIRLKNNNIAFVNKGNIATFALQVFIFADERFQALDQTEVREIYPMQIMSRLTEEESLKAKELLNAEEIE